jgi:hypothetical protein
MAAPAVFFSCVACRAALVVKPVVGLPACGCTDDQPRGIVLRRVPSLRLVNTGALALSHASSSFAVSVP